jgi:hypothetical protein
MPDIAVELFGVRQLGDLTGMNITNIRDAKSEFGPGEKGIDVVFDFDGRRLGAQHTAFHFDDGQTPGKRGSLVRAKEEAAARATQAPFGMWGNPDYRPALKFRIDEKIDIAAGHDNRKLVAETWLVISANLPKWGAAGSTMILPAMVQPVDLDGLCHGQLHGSNFARAYLLLHMGSVAYGWNREDGWRLIADPDAAERERHSARMNDLIFNVIPHHHRGG